MSTVISIKQKSEIFVGRVEDGLKRYAQNRRIVVITDANIDRLYHDIINKYEHIIIGYGEGIKNLITVQNIYARLMEIGADRSTLLVGIGGGIVTDITGFVATTYMRGLDFGFVATTLLAQVDASVGGKNGVNILNYKNMVGTFAQPSFVISDVAFLRTLPHRELHAGMGEVVKMAIIGDEELFNFIEENISASCYTNIDTMQRIVLDSIRLKADIVDRDECEKGIRRVLNLGHTIAHAIEKCSQRYSHGEAVAIGLHHITKVALADGVISEADGSRIISLIERYGFDTELPVERKLLLKAIEGDKKRKGDTIHLILPTAIGEVEDRVVKLTELQNAELTASKG